MTELHKERRPKLAVWMPHAAHLIVGHACRFHLATYTNGYIISTVGEYLPDAPVREILAQQKGITLAGQGDARRADWLNKHDYEEIGLDRKYETMVFPATRSKNGCCPYTAKDWGEIDFEGYNDPEAAYTGHNRMVRKWQRHKGGND